MTVREAVAKKERQISRLGTRQCAWEPGALMGELRDLGVLLAKEEEEEEEEEEGNDRRQRGAREVGEFWEDVRARLRVSDEEVFGNM